MTKRNNNDLEMIREITLEFRFSDLNEIHITEFISLLTSFNQVNRLGIEIINYENFSINNLDDFITDKNQINNVARIRTISKKSPTIIEIVFASIGAFWILLQIIDKVRTWSINKKKLELELEKLKYETSLEYIELMEKGQEILKKLNEGNNQELMNQLANNFEQNQLVLEKIEVKEDSKNKSLQEEPQFA